MNVILPPFLHFIFLKGILPIFHCKQTQLLGHGKMSQHNKLNLGVGNGWILNGLDIKKSLI